jgi:hypothetical protein
MDNVLWSWVQSGFAVDLITYLKPFGQYLLGSEGLGTKVRGRVEREGVEEGGSNDPIIVCTYK